MIEKRIGNGAGRLRIDTSGLDTLSASLAMKLVARVGILGQKGSAEHEKSKQTNASIGLKQEKGSITENIPPRSFIQMPLTRNAKEIFVTSKVIETWVKRTLASGRDPAKAWYLAYKDLGFAGEQVIQRAFEQSGPGWAPNSPVTLAMKYPKDKPLINTGELRRAVASEVKAR